MTIRPQKEGVERGRTQAKPVHFGTMQWQKS
jgi:hypothetical protein